MADSNTVDTSGWSNIMPPASQPGNEANRFDQHRESDQKFGPEPDAPPNGPPETGGRSES